jgi:hypothetical protein
MSVFCGCCLLSALGLCVELIQRSPAEFGASIECDREAP